MPGAGPAVTVPKRPWSTEKITGLMLPDGISESTLGNQRINAHFRNLRATAVSDALIYVESTSHPSLTVTSATYFVGVLPPGGSRALSWDIDVTSVPPGIYLISFIIKNANGLTRVIKKIFVTRVQFNPVTKIFSIASPQGLVQVGFRDLIGPKDGCCGKGDRGQSGDGKGQEGSFLSGVSRMFLGDDANFTFCVPGYLPHLMDVDITRTPPFDGQHGDYPYQDFAWKLFFCIVMLVLLLAAAVACAFGGNCNVLATTGDGDGGGGGGGGGAGTSDCCGVRAQGGGSNKVAAGLVAAAAAAGVAAATSDGPDPISRGQDNTTPAAGELTTHERLQVEPLVPRADRLGQALRRRRQVDLHASHDRGVLLLLGHRYEDEPPRPVTLRDHRRQRGAPLQARAVGRPSPVLRP